MDEYGHFQRAKMGICLRTPSLSTSGAAICMYNWLVVTTPLNNISQWEGLSHIYPYIMGKNVPNHQPNNNV